jgi:hypothetical protein
MLHSRRNPPQRRNRPQHRRDREHDEGRGQTPALITILYLRNIFLVDSFSEFGLFFEGLLKAGNRHAFYRIA